MVSVVTKSNTGEVMSQQLLRPSSHLGYSFSYHWLHQCCLTVELLLDSAAPSRYHIFLFFLWQRALRSSLECWLYMPCFKSLQSGLQSCSVMNLHSERAKWLIFLLLNSFFLMWFSLKLGSIQSCWTTRLCSTNVVVVVVTILMFTATLHRIHHYLHFAVGKVRCRRYKQ